MNTLLHLDVEALPGSLVLKIPLSDVQFEAMCLANDAIQFERTKDGEIRMNPPTELSTSDGNSEINRQLRNWWTTHRQGKVAESNGGFFLRDGSMLSPDAAYISPKTFESVPAKSTRGIPHLCPHFVIELLSGSDSLRDLQAKMKDWIANGAALGWLIDPHKRQVTVYTPGADAIKVSASSIQGSGAVEGFVLDVAEVWRCYES